MSICHALSRARIVDRRSSLLMKLRRKLNTFVKLFNASKRQTIKRAFRFSSKTVRSRLFPLNSSIVVSSTPFNAIGKHRDKFIGQLFRRTSCWFEAKAARRRPNGTVISPPLRGQSKMKIIRMDWSSMKTESRYLRWSRLAN